MTYGLFIHPSRAAMESIHAHLSTRLVALPVVPTNPRRVLLADRVGWPSVLGITGRSGRA